uniref:(northern house mosquito) hypothetical protein n=1 Tax=Culex pipiens TaxID=7175 RepID=A0A8D8K3E0_CULPI
MLIREQQVPQIVTPYSNHNPIPNRFPRITAKRTKLSLQLNHPHKLLQRLSRLLNQAVEPRVMNHLSPLVRTVKVGRQPGDHLFVRGRLQLIPGKQQLEPFVQQRAAE